MDLQTTPKVPNAAFTPVVKFQQMIVSGKLKSSLKIVYQTARLDNGTWQEAGNEQKVLQVGDLDQIPAEFDSVKTELQALFSALSAFTDSVNRARKVL